MQFHNFNWRHFSTSVVLLGILAHSSSAQYRPTDANNPFEGGQTQLSFSSSPLPEIGVQELNDSKSAIRQAANELRDAKDDTAIKQAAEKLQNLLSAYFDEDMQRREAELKEMETRLTKLRAQMQKRLDKKAEIVGLQSKVLANEADGLGFFSNTSLTDDVRLTKERRLFYAPHAEQTKALLLRAQDTLQTLQQKGPLVPPTHGTKPPTPPANPIAPEPTPSNDAYGVPVPGQSP